MDGRLGGTFTIIARDPHSGYLGIAVQSRVLAVGAQVAWADPRAGAVATQAWSNPTYGPHGLTLLREGRESAQVVRMLLDGDDERNVRQVGIMDVRGHVAVHTGKHCIPWAGHVAGENAVCLGNTLTSRHVVEGMYNAFHQSADVFAERLLAALEAGQAAGGDWRGQESAALLVVGERADEKGLGDRVVDLRVDHHGNPIEMLKSLLALQRQRTEWKRQEAVTVGEDLTLRIQVGLRVLGYYAGPLTRQWDALTAEALRHFCDDRGILEPDLAQGAVRVTTIELLRRLYATA